MDAGLLSLSPVSWLAVQDPQEPDKTEFEDKDAQFDVQMPQGCGSECVHRYRYSLL